MDIVNLQVNELFDEITMEGLSYENALILIRNKSEYLENDEKLALLKELKSRFEKPFGEHLKICPDPSDCETNKWNIPFLHIMANDIKKLEKKLATASINPDFSEMDQQRANVFIDEIREEIEKLKTGQEIIWTDVMNELEEMKKMFFLNKKNWRQLLTGKLVEMVASGIISETVSKKIVDLIKPTAKNLLE
jgi:hypothetical protein